MVEACLRGRRSSHGHWRTRIINSGVFEQRIVDVVLHTSRRFMRSKDGANAMLALKAAMRYAAAADNATDKPDELVRRRREYLTPTLAYDAGYIAEWNGWPALRDVYLEAGNRMVESANPDEIERIYDALALYYDENYGFKAPTPVAAMEFFARIARRLPADNEHHKLTTRTWPTLELLYRNDPARAARVAADNLDQYRKQPNADAATIAFLLQSYADAVIESDPEKAWPPDGRRSKLSARRRALNRIASGCCLRSRGTGASRETRLARSATSTRPSRCAARRLASTRGRLHASTCDSRCGCTTMEIERAPRRWRNRLSPPVLAATTGPAARWLRYSAARSLAQIVAADGDLKRARALYEEYVFPVTDNAVASGDAVPHPDAARAGYA